MFASYTMGCSKSLRAGQAEMPRQPDRLSTAMKRRAASRPELLAANRRNGKIDQLRDSLAVMCHATSERPARETRSTGRPEIPGQPPERIVSHSRVDTPLLRGLSLCQAASIRSIVGCDKC